jgi:predicted DNA-binding transcriptional regulator AlpA
MPQIPPDQRPAVKTTRGPHDHDTPPHDQRHSAQSGTLPAETAGVCQRHGNPGVANDEGEDDKDTRLPTFVRFKELRRAGIVGSWTQLFRMIDDDGFPAGVLLSPNVRAWRLDHVERWLATRPTARKVMPPAARPQATGCKRWRGSATGTHMGGKTTMILGARLVESIRAE